MRTRSPHHALWPLFASALVVVACGARTDPLLGEPSTHADADAALDAAPDSFSDAPSDTAADSSIDASFETGVDSSVDSSVDASLDASFDASLDAPVDAADAGVDAAPEASIDAPIDSPEEMSPPIVAGCADGDREGFVDLAAYPDIAGCSGGWSVPGVMLQDPGTAPACPTIATFDTVDPACGRMAGNDGPNPTGTGCNVADLCAAGWHVCTGAADVASSSPTGCTGATQPTDPPLFFTSRQSSTGFNACATGSGTGPNCSANSGTSGCAQTADTSNDVYGCGNLANQGIPFQGCGPLDTSLGFDSTSDVCGGGAPPGSNWSCTDDGSGTCEAYVLAHGGPGYGGALCCRDSGQQGTCMLWLKMNADASGNPVDSSLYARSVVSVTGASQVPGGGPGGPSSVDAWSFDGVNGYLGLPYFDMTTVSAVTFTAWFLRSAPPGPASQESLVYHGGGGELQLVYLEGSDQVSAGIKAADNNWYNAPAPFPAAHDTTWAHLAGTWTQGQGVQLYLDGQLVASVAAANSPLNPLPVSWPSRVGMYGGSNTQGFEGTLADVRIYARALSAAEVQAVYAGQAVGCGM